MSNICPLSGKHAHKSKGKAEAQLRDLRSKDLDDGKLRVYRCKCGAWHVGHAKLNAHMDKYSNSSSC